ncbi:MAG TPA: M15 family metallopeptidase [Pyrinomonadaceae bacterium]|nr:M15 family metallopeptidase [Pyrinomonadaceae bacterium]
MTRSRPRVDHQVPITSPEMFAAPYADIPVDRSDPRGREQLVRLDSVGVAFESYYAKTDGSNPPFCCAIEGSRQDIWLRKSVAEKLGRINEMLRPYEAELFVFDGHRTVACQQGLWNFYHAKAKQENPGGSGQEHRARARQFIVDPASFDENDPRTWPAHTNGAAVDLTLRDSLTRQLLDMGANFEEDSDSAASAGDYFERELAAGRIDENDVRLQNRRLLNWAMAHEGLLNETAKVFWHYDWGNQIYVRASRALLPNPPEAAWYGYIALPR